MPTATANTLPLMAHLVLGYPTLAQSLTTAHCYAQAGARYIEVQLPFSHPTADGPRITHANQIALTNGYDPTEALRALGQLIQEYPRSQCIVMCYANKLLGSGGAALLAQLKAIGVQQLIVPDLPFDSPAADTITRRGFALVPVLAPNLSAARLQQVVATQPQLVYIMAGYKLTGSGFGLDARLPTLVQQLHSHTQAQVGIGFGIRDAHDAQAVLAVADFAIVGSALLQAADEGVLPQWLQQYAHLCATTNP